MKNLYCIVHQFDVLIICYQIPFMIGEQGQGTCRFVTKLAVSPTDYLRGKSFVEAWIFLWKLHFFSNCLCSVCHNQFTPIRGKDLVTQWKLLVLMTWTFFMSQRTGSDEVQSAWDGLEWNTLSSQDFVAVHERYCQTSDWREISTCWTEQFR